LTMKMFSKKTNAIILLSLFAALGMISVASASFNFQTKWPTSPMGTDIMGADNPSLALGIKYLYEWGVGLGGLAVFIALIIAGFEYITSIGNPSKMQDAFARIRDAVIGLVILLSSYAILNLVGIPLSSLKVDVLKTDEIDMAEEIGCKSPKDCCDTTTNEECYVGWECKEGICQPNKKTVKCKSIMVTLSSGKDIEIKGTEEQDIPAGTYPVSMKKIPEEGDECYDPRSTASQDPNKPLCACGLEVFTKRTIAGSESVASKKCGNVNVTAIQESDGLNSYSKASEVVCLRFRSM